MLKTYRSFIFVGVFSLLGSSATMAANFNIINMGFPDAPPGNPVPNIGGCHFDLIYTKHEQENRRHENFPKPNKTVDGHIPDGTYTAVQGKCRMVPFQDGVRNIDITCESKLPLEITDADTLGVTVMQNPNIKVNNQGQYYGEKDPFLCNVTVSNSR